MSGSQETANRPTMANIPDSLATQLHRKAGAEKFGLTPQAFAGVLHEVAAKYLPATASPSEVSDFVTHLRVEELALARACALGNETAWEIFLTRYREKLYNAAHTIVQGDANARELADSLYADALDGWPAKLQAELVHGPRFARGLAASGPGTGICKPLSPPTTPGKHGGTNRGGSAV